MPGIGVALSGGGNRASLFNLGVLMYLADAGKSAEVRSIASVSGGSVANAYVAQAGPYEQLSGPAFEDAVRPFARRIARRGTLWAWWGTYVYLTMLALLASLIVLAAIGKLPDAFGISHLGCYVGTTAGLLLVLAISRRNVVCARAFTATLYSRNGKPTLLCDVGQGECEHVFCATELHAGEHFYFSGRFVYSYRMGLGRPADVRLADAVQASANFPVAFPPRVMPTAPHCFQGGTNSASRLFLLDGGVYDNMADQWLTGLEDRRRRWPASAPPLPVIDQAIVVNAGTNLPWSSQTALRIPILGELLAIKRLLDVLYDNTTTFRRKGLVAGFQNAVLTNKGLRSALVMLEQSPLKLADAFQNAPPMSPEKQRTGAVLAALGAARKEWDEVVEMNTRVKTTFRRLGVDVSANLLYQGYVTAMANLHVILDYPLLPVPQRMRFVGMTEE